MKRAILLSTSSISAAIAAAAVAAIALAVVASGNSALAASSLVNGSFETGDLSGWSVDTTASGGTASAVSSYYDCAADCWSWNTWTPTNGSYFAQLTPGEQSQDTKISQPFEASAGDRVSGWAFVEGSNWSDELAVGEAVIKSDSGTTVATPFQQRAMDCEIWAPCNGQWTYWEYTVPAGTATAKYQVEARIHNTGDPDQSYMYSVMGLDDVKTSTLAPDSTKPSTSATRSVEPNAAGWNKEDVTANLKATDNQGGWGVKKITYSASGAQTIAQTDASGSSADVNLTAEGTTTLTYYATDNAGNVEDKKTLTVKIDKTAPTVKSTSPTNRAINVALSSKISATFLESGSDIDPSTLTTDTFKVTKWTRDSRGANVSAPVSGNVSYNATSKTVTFTPSSPLAKGTTYQATINGYNDPRVEDKADNPLQGGGGYTWSFSTGGKLCCGF